MSQRNNSWDPNDTEGTGDETQLNEQEQNGEGGNNGRQFEHMLADHAVLSDLNGSPADLWLLSDYSSN